jgi:DNA-binding transcriptional MerR regulator
MLIQVGELAKRAGMTVRTLHHYEQTGLLTPSARSEAGYRLYNLSAVQRLHMIKALAQAGLELATIKDYLDRQTLSLPELLTQQIETLNAQLRDVGRLRDRLLVLREALASGNEPDLESWLQTLELMKMYDRWFSQQELAAPFAAQDEQRAQAWRELTEEVQTLMASGCPTDSPQAMSLATRWMERLEQDTAGRPEFLTRLNEMHAAEPQMRNRPASRRPSSPLSPRPLPKANWPSGRGISTKRDGVHPPALFRPATGVACAGGEAASGVREGIAPDSASGQALARAWLELFQSYAGTRPQTLQKFRRAMEQEPHLMKGTWMTPAVLSWLQQATGVDAAGAGPAAG